MGNGAAASCNSIVGTFNYMPPEVMASGEWTAQGDIYSLGVLSYQMLTGTLPVGRWEFPSVLFREIPVFWDHVLDVALRSKPEERFRSADDFTKACSVPVTAKKKTRFARLNELFDGIIETVSEGATAIIESEWRQILVVLGVVAVIIIAGTRILLAGSSRNSTPDPAVSTGVKDTENSLYTSHALYTTASESTNAPKGGDNNLQPIKYPVLYEPPPETTNMYRRGYAPAGQHVVKASSLGGSVWQTAKGILSFDKNGTATLGSSLGTWRADGVNAIISISSEKINT